MTNKPEKWEPRPTPYVTGETEVYWKSASEGQLVLSECQECGLVFHYGRALCPDCFSDDVKWIESKGVGKVFTYTLMRQISGWPDDDLPLVVAYIELKEGPRMMSNVYNIDPKNVEIDLPVKVDFVGTDNDDIAIPIFGPM